jgi:hypothetical protein
MSGPLGQARRRWIVVVAALAVLTAVSPFFVPRMSRKIAFSLIRDEKRDESSGIVTLFHGLTESLADMCYNKSTHYQHGGVLYRVSEDILGDSIREQVDRETEATTETAETAADHDEHDHEADAEHEHEHEAGDHHHHEGISLIPEPDDDFRGIIGDVEREIKPYATVHVPHTKGEESLPWLRLATLINPRHEKSYVATAHWLQRSAKRNPHAISQAIALLKEAIRISDPKEGQIPKEQSLYYMLGHIYLAILHEPAKALKVLERALPKSIEDKEQVEQLDAIQQDWMAFNFRYAALACKELNDHEGVLRICGLGVQLFPMEGTLYKLTRRARRLMKAEEKKVAPKAP